MSGVPKVKKLTLEHGSVNEKMMVLKYF